MTSIRKKKAVKGTGAKKAARAVTAARTSSVSGASKKGARKKSPAEPGARRKLIRPLIAVAGCLALGAALGAGAKAFYSWLSTSPRLAIEEVVVKSGERAPEDEIRMLADIEEGDNILSFRLAEAVRAIEIHPWVESASVMRELPDRVVIDVKERELACAIALGGLYYVDWSGEIFKKALPGEDIDLPVITGVGLREAVEDADGVRGRILTALDILELSRGSEVLPPAAVSEIGLDRTYGAFLVRAGDGLRVDFGAGDFPAKWRRMELTLIELGGEAVKVRELDLNYESRVTVHLREGYRVASATDDVPGEF